MLNTLQRSVLLTPTSPQIKYTHYKTTPLFIVKLKIKYKIKKLLINYLAATNALTRIYNRHLRFKLHPGKM